jgi:hypothetical protein
MANGIGWKTAELQIETLVPGVLLVLGIDAVLQRHFSTTIEPPLRDDAFLKTALLVATAYAGGVLQAIFCRFSLDRLSEAGMRSWVFSRAAHVHWRSLCRNRLSVDKDRFVADYRFERKTRKHPGSALWNAAYRSAIRKTSRQVEVDRRRSQGRILRNLALPASLWMTVVFQPTPVGWLCAVVCGLAVYLGWVLLYAYAEYVNFAEAYDITA